MQVLAGLIDTDGSLNANCYEITQENEVLMDDILYLARSLGFAAYKATKKGSYTRSDGSKFVGTYYRTFISGMGLDKVPVKVSRKQAQARKQVKDVLVTGFSIKACGYGRCILVVLDGNQRHLLGNFTIS
jgi:hypothetical protein